MTSIISSWTLEDLKHLPIPDDFHHLWNVLIKNPESTLTEKILNLQIKSIPDLRPNEVSELISAIRSVINNFTLFYKINVTNRYYHLGVCFLKYGLDGISIRYKESCTRCGEIRYMGEDEEYEPFVGECKAYGLSHELQIKDLAGYVIIICEHCGLCKKIGFDTDSNSTCTLGPCFTVKHRHSPKLIRELYCQYEQYF